MVGISIKNRYAIKAILGQGGMGVVYHAFDTVMRRDVAVKTLRDVPSNIFLELFSRECSVLAAMVHPNVVEVFDMGEFEEDGISKPYFVMPLLPGCTLHDLIYPSAVPLSATRCVDIIAQACRGLQAAHERDLLHRDIKPRNIFVMRDDAVKVIDFGVAHLMGGNSTGVRGTTQYMSPEQISFKPLNNRSDLFSLAVVCYEALTAAHPFLRRADRRDSEVEIVEAITTLIPPLASDLNPSVNRNVAQVVAKGMAKDVWNRYESAAAFAEALHKALRNENSGPTTAAVRARLDRARRSFDEKDLQFASEIVSQLEAEGYSDPGIGELRQQLDEAVLRERTERLVTAANRCFEDEEYTLALRKIQEILEIDAANPAALNLKKKTENLLTEQRIGEFLKVATDHLGRSQFNNARQAVQDALKLRPSDTRARLVLAEVDAKQKEVLRQRQEQERLFQAAQAAFFAGKIALAIENLDQLSRLTSQSNEVRERADDYKELQRRVMAELEGLKTALAQANGLLDQDLGAAQKICDKFLAKYADQADFVELGREITRRREAEAEAFRKSVAAKVESEDSLDARLRILEDAVKSRPNDEYFQQQIRDTREKAKKVAAIADRARALERQRDFPGAIREWENLESLYPRYPGLSDDVARARKALEKQRLEIKADLSRRIDKALLDANYEASGKLIAEAEREFPSDADIGSLRVRREQQMERVAKVDSLLSAARKATEQGHFQDTANSLSEAGEASADILSLKRRVFQASLDQVEAIAGGDWQTAKTILERTAKLDPQLSVPAKFWEDVLRRERDENVERILAGAAAAKDLQQARSLVQQGLEKYAKEPRLQTNLASIDKAILEKRQREERARDLENLHALRNEFRSSENPGAVRDLRARSKSLAERYPKDPEFTSVALEISEQVGAFEVASDALSQGALERAFQVSNEVLAIYPEHRLFLNLRTQVETREREKAAEFLANVAQQLATGKDLAKRRTILEDALRRYPNEPYFSDELALVRNEEEIIQTIADRAQNLESNGFTSEALEQWTHLKATYPLYPGVDRAIANCNETIKQKRAQLRAGLQGAIRKAVDSRDYETALKRVREAQAEFPGDEEFTALSNSISERSKLRTQALSLIKKAEGSFKSGQFSTGHERLLQALRVGEHESDIPATVAAILIGNAGQALKTDLATAELMVADARAADPGVVVPADLERSLRAARRLRDFESFRSEAQALEANGSLTDALRRSRDFLSDYPGDAQAQEIQNRLVKAKEQREASQRRDQQLSELRSVADEAKTVTHVENLLDLLKRTKQIARQSAVDADVTKAAEQVSRVISAMAQIRKLIDEGRLNDAEALCAQSVAEFPNESAFEQWRAEIEVRQIERASEYLREVEQKLAQEPDFGKQEQILGEAIRFYPNESYYSDELALVRSKQLLLSAELARARDLELKELFEDAVREWEGLRNAYPWYPGIDNEVERVRQAWIARTTAIRNNWLARIYKPLQTGNVEQAAAFLEEARVELAGDPVLKDLEAQIEKAKQAQVRRRDLVSRGGDAFRVGQFAEGVQLLKTASEVFKEDVSFRDWILDLMLNEAKSVLGSNWQGSETLLNAIRQIRPAFPIPSDLPETIRVRRREEEVLLLLEQAALAEKGGNLSEALRLLDAGVAKFPEDARIGQRRQVISEQIRQLEIRQIREQAQQQADAIRLQLQSAKTKRQLAKVRASPALKRLSESSDAEVSKLATALLARIDSKAQELQTPAQTASGLKRFWYVPVIVVVLLGALLAAWLRRKPEPKPAEVAQVEPVTLAVPPIEIDGNIQSADVYLDGTKTGELKAGSALLSNVSPGAHVLKISGGEGEASIPIFQDSAAGPRITGPITASRVSVAALTTDGQKGTLTTSMPDSQPVSFDRQNAGSTVKGSLDFPSLVAGSHQLQIGPSNRALSFSVVVQPKPSLYVLTSVGPAIATPDVPKTSQAAEDLPVPPKPAVLEIISRASGTRVKVDGDDLGDLRVGRTSSRSLPAGSHIFEISRQGFVSKRIARKLEPGRTMTLNGDDLSLAPLAPAAPDAAAREAADWGSVDRSNATALNAYLSKYPAAAHSNEAQHLLDQFAAADKSKAEQRDWDSLDKSKKDSLRVFVSKYPNGTHVSAAQQMLSDMAKQEKQTELANADDNAWTSVNGADQNSIQRYLGQFPSGRHAGQAQQALASLSQQPAKVQQPAASQSPAAQPDAANVLAVLQRFAAAWSAKDVDAILRLQPGLSRRQIKGQLEPVKSWRMSITPAGAPQINGDHAEVTCRRNNDQVFSDGTERPTPESTVTYVLRRQGSSWVIDSIKAGS